MDHKNKKWIILFLFFMLICIINTAKAVDWESSIFGGEVEVGEELDTYWHSSTFGGEVTVYCDDYDFIDAYFGGEVDVEGYTYSNWSDYWMMEHATKPVITNPNPSNNSDVYEFGFLWNCTIENPDGNDFNWSIECSNGQSNSSTDDTNGSKNVSLSGLTYNTVYAVWVNASSNRSEDCNVTEFFYFTTYAPPILSNPGPANGSEVAESFTPLSIDITDGDGDLMAWSIQLSDGTISSDANEPNGTITHDVTLSEGESYTWWVNVTDGTNWTREWFTFTTSSNQAPIMSSPNPANGSLGNDVDTTNSFSIALNDPEGDSITWTIQVETGDSSSGSLQNNGTKSCSITTPLDYSREYTVWVNATDPAGSGTWNRSWFIFTTEATGGNPPTVTINATTGIEETNATGNAYVSASVFPATGWFRYGTSLSSLSSTTPEVVTLGAFSKNIPGLTPGEYYYIQARSSNAYGTNSTSYLNFLTKPNPPTNLATSTYNHSSATITWTKGTGADTTVLERNNAPDWARGAGAEVYNGTASTYQDTVNAATTYYYQAWSYAGENGLHNYSDVNATLNFTTLPQPPQNVAYGLDVLGNGTANLTITWNKGTGADTTLIRKQTEDAPDDETEGTEVYNDSGTSEVDEYISEPYLYTLWSYNSSSGQYSEPVYLGWYASWINVYNESKPSQAIEDWNVEISNVEGDEVYESNSNTNPLIINISDMPTGDNIGFSFSASGYKNRVYKKDVAEDGAILLNAYLPPNIVPDGGGGGTGGGGVSDGDLHYHVETGNISDYTTDETINLDYEIYEIDVVEKYERVGYDRFIHADSKTVSNPTEDLVMILNFTCDEIYQIVAYENINAEDVYTDSASVSNPSVDKNISFTHTPVGKILGVYQYNSSLYGGWTWVSADNYSYDSSNLTVNQSGMDDNTTMVKVDYILNTTAQGVAERPIAHNLVTITNGVTATINQSALNVNTSLVRIEYYTYINEYYNWIYIPKQKYSNTSTSVTINASQLSSDTLLIRVKYYSYEYSSYIEPKLYILQVIDPSNSPVYDAKVIVKRYINTTGEYEEVGSYITDGNGQIEIFLIPFVNYKVQINASDKGFETKTYDYTPSDSVFVHTFRLQFEEQDPIDDNAFSGITWSIEPNSHYQRGNFTIYFNITSDDNELEWFKAIFYYYNTTTEQWEQVYTENITDQAGGGSISYTISGTNISLISGRYKIEGWYKKEGYDAYEVTQTGSTIFFLEYGGIVSSPVWDYIPDWVFLLVVVIIMAIVMAVLLPIAGLATGYIGIGIFALALMLKPDLIIEGVAGWAILTITFIVYTVALFIWSRI